MTYWYDGKVHDGESVSLPIASLSWQRGDGLFETLRVNGGEIYFLARHINRLQRSISSLGFTPISDEYLSGAIAQLVRSIGSDELHRARITYYRDGALLVTMTPISLDVRPARFGIAQSPISTELKASGNKTTSYFEFMQRRSEAIALGFDDALLVNQHHLLTESSLANVIFEVNGQLRTPSLASGALPGITRELVLGWSPEIAEVDTSIDEIDRITAAATLSSVHGVVPIASIAGRELTRSPQIDEVSRRFEELARQNPSF